MNIKSLLCALTIYSGTICGFFENTKNIQIGTQAHKCFEQLGRVIKKTDFFTQDFKELIKKTENAKKIRFEFAQFIAAVCHLVTSRPDTGEVNQTLKRLKNTQDAPTLQDVMLLFRTMQCYGEPTLNGNDIASLSSEPTSSSGLYRLSFYRTALDNIHNKVRSLAEKNNWSKEQIDAEKRFFNEKLIKFIQNHQTKNSE